MKISPLPEVLTALICASGSFWVVIVFITDFLMRSDTSNFHEESLIRALHTNQTKIWYWINLTCQKLAGLTVCNLNERTPSIWKWNISTISRSAEKRWRLSQPLSAAGFDLFKVILSALCDFKYISMPKLPVGFHLFLHSCTCPRIWLYLKAMHYSIHVQVYTSTPPDNWQFAMPRPP